MLIDILSGFELNLANLKSSEMKYLYFSPSHYVFLYLYNMRAGMYHGRRNGGLL